MTKSVNVQGAKGKKKATSDVKLNSILGRLDLATRNLPKGTFAKAGAGLGGILGGPSGALAGGLAGAGIAAITGRGDYVISSNSIATVAGSMDSLPQFAKNKHTVRVRHREFFSDLVVPAGGVNYVNRSFVLNPGNPIMFPWLASIAKQYQQYKVRGMVVEYKSNTSDYAASGPLGIVGIASNYNVNELPFSDTVTFENSEYAVVTKPSMCIMHAIECAPNTGRDEFLYVRDPLQVDLSQINDSRFYDMASVQIMTSGLPGTTGQLLGQLWVSYDIEFSKPVVSPTTIAPYVVSNSDGTVAARGTSRATSVATEYTYVPATSTSYLTHVPSSGVYSSGDATLLGTVYTDFTATTMRIRRNGTYRIIVWLSGNTTPTNYSLASPGAISSYSTCVGVGSATVGSTKFDHGKVAVQLGTQTAPTGYDCALFTEFEVSGCNTTSDYVLYTPGTFSTNSGVLLSSVKVHVDLEWIQVIKP